VKTFALIALAYLCGSVPVGFLLASLAGIDIRRQGSGNIGATNVARVVGWREGVLTLLGDVLKGFLPVLLSLYFGFEPWAIFWVGLASFLGHLYPVFLKFKGGKGVATSAGALLALTPLATLIGVVVWIIVFWLTRYVSLASLTAAVVLPLVILVISLQDHNKAKPLVYASACVAAIVVWRHRSNLCRLLRGTEPRFTRK